ncbi:RyR domain-containing protein [Salipiger sp. 1_MG-2023]|uniref:RyR domain-containing protein n=1 Tax=Salipiger sp. 1_MG-2023 TaxID=3062665 RepID=UPI0026E167C3|nr:RyR domain-containing protein [Salipiger sp. 1_MG-2023]MDO6587260.1 RyR domain-containing protein [Salipiger sp. 1_MG-2023]
MAPTALAAMRGQDRVHIVLVGLGSVNLAVAEEIVLRCHDPPQKAPMLTVVDCDPARAEARLRVERPDPLNPDFGPDGPCILFFGMDAMQCCAAAVANALFEVERNTPLTAIVVSTGDDTCNVGIAMRLRQLQIERLGLRAPIYLRHGLLAHVAPEEVSDLTAGIVRFGGRFLDDADKALEHLHHDLARRVHETSRNAPDVVPSPKNAWPALSETARRASYRAALSAIELFYAAGLAPPPGAGIAGLRLASAAGNAVLGNTQLIDTLSMAEHGRWCAERRTDGYCHAPVRDTEHKRHPLIVPFAELPDDQRAKDRRNVKEALTFSMQLHETAPRQPCWRMQLRIGVIGPLATEAVDLGAALDTILKRRPGAEACDLEILTPNAPGFDRLATVELAARWFDRTGRTLRILAMPARERWTESR